MEEQLTEAEIRLLERAYWVGTGCPIPPEEARRLLEWAGRVRALQQLLESALAGTLVITGFDPGCGCPQVRVCEPAAGLVPPLNLHRPLRVLYGRKPNHKRVEELRRQLLIWRHTGDQFSQQELDQAAAAARQWAEETGERPTLPALIRILWERRRGGPETAGSA